MEIKLSGMSMYQLSSALFGKIAKQTLHLQLLNEKQIRILVKSIQEELRGVSPDIYSMAVMHVIAVCSPFVEQSKLQVVADGLFANDDKRKPYYPEYCQDCKENPNYAALYKFLSHVSVFKPKTLLETYFLKEVDKELGKLNHVFILPMFYKIMELSEIHQGHEYSERTIKAGGKPVTVKYAQHPAVPAWLLVSAAKSKVHWLTSESTQTLSRIEQEVTTVAMQALE